MTPSQYDPLKFGELSLGERDDPREQRATVSKGDALFQDAGGEGEPAKGGPILGNAPPKSGPRQRNPLPPAGGAGREGHATDQGEADVLTSPPVQHRGSRSRHGSPSRHGPSSHSGRREPLPSRKDHAAYSRMPMPQPAASRIVPAVVLLLGLGTAGYLALAAEHYPMAIFMALISIVAAPLARMIFQGAIE